MSVHTAYDDKRDELRDILEECLDLAKELVVSKEWGYDHMRPDYAMDVYQAVKTAYDKI